jgi:pyruvate/2-oxoglutarate/acetoin dehydrogenase E1 component
MNRELKYYEALREAQDVCMAADDDVYLFGLGVPGPTGIFGTTTGLVDKYGAERVVESPAAENALTGVALGTAAMGMRPIVIHMRVDFALLSIEPLINQAAKWHYMYGGKMKAPMVVRMIIGRGWGQGPQHAQSLQSWFAHIPGLKVVMPTTPHDAKGMLIAAVEDDAPVVVLEHRWLYGLSGPVPEGHYTTPLDQAKVVRKGQDVTIVAASFMTIEAISAANMLADMGISAEVVDMRSLTHIDEETILDSVRKTGALLVADTAYAPYGVTSEVIGMVAEKAHGVLSRAPKRVALPFAPSPTTAALADAFYPHARTIVHGIMDMFDIDANQMPPDTDTRQWRDQPDPSFTGPY